MRYINVSIAIFLGIVLFFVPSTALPMPFEQEKILHKFIYNLEVNGQIYFVLDDNINCKNNILWKRRFLTSNGKPVTDTETIRKLVKMAWVHENLTSTNPEHIWETVLQKITRVNALIDTYWTVKTYEKAQEYVVRMWVDTTLAVALHNPVSNTMISSFAYSNIGDLIKSDLSFKQLMRWVSLAELYDAKYYLENCQKRIEEVKRKPLKYEDAEYIYNYYMKGYSLLCYGHLLNDFNPKHWHDLVIQAIDTSWSEIVNLVLSTPSDVYPNPEVRDFKDLLSLVDKTYSVLSKNLLPMETKLPGLVEKKREFEIFYKTANNFTNDLSMCLISDLAAQVDSYVDLGDLGDEHRHNLRGWDAINPGLLPAMLDSDVTSRYQRLRSSNSVDVFVPQVGHSYTLSFRTEDGLCDDSFDVYINGSGPLYGYRHRTSSQVYPLHQVVVPSTLVTGITVTVTFVNVSSDSCGRAATYFVRLD